MAAPPPCFPLLPSNDRSVFNRSRWWIGKDDDSIPIIWYDRMQRNWISAVWADNFLIMASLAILAFPPSVLDAAHKR